MADVVITIKIMPASPDADLDVIRETATKMIADFGGEVGKHELEPVAFGLKAVKLLFVMSEELGGTDDLEAKISEIENVQSVSVVDVRRALG